jgi:hypothetical protein
MNETAIACALLSATQRSAHVEDLFGPHFSMQLEPHVFDTASLLSPDYHGGYWEFYDLSNGAFYMAPECETPFHVLCPNGFEGVLSGDGLGLVVCLYAYSHLSFIAAKPAATTYARMYHLLRDYVVEHREVAQVLRATD